LLSGEPWADDNTNRYDITLFCVDDPSGAETDGWEFGEGRRCNTEFWIVSETYGARILKAVPHQRDDKYPLSGRYASTIVAALAAARGARFEHGESGSG
jgi:hypothetical protein